MISKPSPFLSKIFNTSGPYRTWLVGDNLLVLSPHGKTTKFSFETGLKASLSLPTPFLACDSVEMEEDVAIISSALEFIFATEPHITSIGLVGPYWEAIRQELTIRGLCVISNTPDATATVYAEMVWQSMKIWLKQTSHPYPEINIYNGHCEHLVRPPKPSGQVYGRFIPWLGGRLTFDVATLDDLPHLHVWLNKPRIDQFWREAGELAKHRCYLEGKLKDPNVIPMIGKFEDHPFAYFEIYWAKEDLIGTFCNADAFDRGCHLLVGEDDYRGREWFTAWLPSLMHMIFLDDPRTQRIVQEPDALHHKQISNLQKSGFNNLRTVNLPQKKATIVTLSRHRFFSERLWHPV